MSHNQIQEMKQEQQHLLMTIHSKLVSLKEHGEVTEQLVIRDIANDAIDDILKLRDSLTSEKEGDLSDDEKKEWGSTQFESNDEDGFNEFLNQKQ